MFPVASRAYGILPRWSRQMCCRHDALVEKYEVCKSLTLAQTQVGLFPDSDEKDKVYVAQMTRPDPSSFANYDVVKVTHYHLDLVVDFASSTFKGSVIATAVPQIENAQVVVFDIRDVNVKGAFLVSERNCTEAGTPLEFWVTRKEGKLGQAVVVKVDGMVKDEAVFIRFEYETSPSASAAQWLKPEQTVGKKHPYLFTQCQAIHARSLMVCQDTPGNKTTFAASLYVTPGLQALMSAILESEVPAKVTRNGTEFAKWDFVQNVPIPIYLLAVLVGNLEKRDLSERCAVWSEPEVVDKAAWEYADLEKILRTAENICGPYAWGRYDLVNAPQAFPYGGMEGQLTLLTPSLLAGDRSLVNVIAHEAAHSWSGNLVTNDDWQSFFLNEGFTVFIERKILQDLEGLELKGLHTMIGWESLKQSIADFGKEQEQFTSLQIDLTNDVDPDDSFSSVPYEKGYTLLDVLEQRISEPVMRAFLKAYFAHFKYQNLNCAQFVAFFLDFCEKNGVADKVAGFDWKLWMRGYGLPPEKPVYLDVLAKEVVAFVQAFIASDDGKIQGDISSWNSTQMTVLLDQLQDAQETAILADSSAQAKWAVLTNAINNFYPFKDSTNAELLSRYLTLVVRSGISGYEDKIGSFLTSYGRMKFVRPLYRDLFKSRIYRDFGIKLFADNREFYHNICATMVLKDQADITSKPYVW